MMKLKKFLQPEELKRLPHQQLQQIKQSLHKFFYSAGTNIAFYSAFRSKRTQVFKQSVFKAIKKQIVHIATLDKINEIVGRREKISDIGMTAKVAIFWLLFSDVLDGGRDTVDSYLFWAGERGGESGLDKMIPPPHEFTLDNLKLKNELEQRSGFLLRTVNKTGIKWTANTIQQALEEKMTSAEIVKYLRDRSSEIAKERSDMISETELIYAMNVVEIETFKRNGIEKYKWVTSEDERVCEICMANEAAGVLELGERFPMGTLAPPAHPLCRCYLIPTLPNVIEGVVWRGK